MQKKKPPISRPKVFRILSIICLLPLFLVVPYFKYIPPLDAMSAFLGISGFSFTFYQLYQSSRSSEYNDLSKHIDRIEQDYLREISEASGNCSDKIDNHQQAINWLIERVNQLNIEVKTHEKTPGHSFVIGDLAKLREELAEVKAAIAVMSRFGELVVRVDNLERRG